MSLTLWVATGLLAAVALLGGSTKMFIPKEKLAKQPGARWVGDSSVGFVKMLGVFEIFAAIGLIVPALVDIAPILVPVTAVCWTVLMICAIIVHLRYGEVKVVALNLVYLALAAFIAWGRFGAESFIG